MGRPGVAQPSVRRANLDETGGLTALVFARTETAGFVRTVWGKADAVMFLHGRLHFHRVDGTGAPANAGAPSALVAYGRSDAEALERSGLAGTIVMLDRVGAAIEATATSAATSR